jgi:hypothetical protein
MTRLAQEKKRECHEALKEKIPKKDTNVSRRKVPELVSDLNSFKFVQRQKVVKVLA